MKFKAYFDGSRKRDGSLGAGALIVDEHENVIWEQKIDCKIKSKHPAEAEMMGCLALLNEMEQRKELVGSEITMYGDYKVLIDVLNNKQRFNHPKLNNLWLQITRVLGFIKCMRNISLKFVWIPRDQNTSAHQLAVIV